MMDIRDALFSIHHSSFRIGFLSLLGGERRLPDLSSVQAKNKNTHPLPQVVLTFILCVFGFIQGWSAVAGFFLRKTALIKSGSRAKSAKQVMAAK